MTRSRHADRPRRDQRIWPRRLAAIGVTAGLLLASGCAAPAQEPEGPWHLRVGLGAAFEPTNLVPGKQGNITATLTLTDNVVETLVRNSPEGDLEGLLAESWEQGATENIWRFHLREGVLFPDGSELDAQTVSNSMDTIRDPAYSSALAPYYRGLERIDVVDTYTVDFVLTQPDSLWPALLNTFPILPNGIDVEDPTTWNGTGPYTLGKVDVNLVELEKKDDYWGGTTAGPEQVTISSVTEAASMTTGLSTGTLDVGHPISPDLVDTLPDSFVASPSQVMMIKLNALRPPFDDPLVREAVALGVDMEGNRKSLIGDEFSMDARCQWVAEGNVGFAPDVTTPEYDPERAKELIAEAGAAADAKIRLAVPAAYYLAGEEISTVV
ncbi:MAG: ABC transporter substrate-binding protein, partial [Mycetocola sp.]